MEEERITHESFAQISFSRIQTAGNHYFYGSELRQNNYIQLEIQTSEMVRNMTDDKFHGKERIIQVRMTANQFSELITSFNVGDGVPCTIVGLNGKFVEQKKVIESRKTFLHRKFSDRMKTFSNSLTNLVKRAKELVAKKTLSTNDQKELISSIDYITTEVKSNIPYFAECFQETVDNIVAEGAMEAENKIMHKIQSLGLESLKNSLFESENIKSIENT